MYRGCRLRVLMGSARRRARRAARWCASGRDVLGRLLCVDLDSCLCPAQGGCPTSGGRYCNEHVESIFLARGCLLPANQWTSSRDVPEAGRTHRSGRLSNRLLRVPGLRRPERHSRGVQQRTTPRGAVWLSLDGAKRSPERVERVVLSKRPFSVILNSCLATPDLPRALYRRALEEVISPTRF